MSHRQNYSREEWDLQKDNIHSIYIKNKQTLDQLRRELDEKGFRPSKNALIEKLKDWQFKKNSSAQQWRDLHENLKRKNIDLTRAEVVNIDNCSISTKKLKKEFARYSNQGQAEVSFDTCNGTKVVESSTDRLRSEASARRRKPHFTPHQPETIGDVFRLPMFRLLRVLLQPMLESLGVFQLGHRKTNSLLFIQLYTRIRIALLDRVAIKRPNIQGTLASNDSKATDSGSALGTSNENGRLHRNEGQEFLLFDSVLPNFGTSAEASSFLPNPQIDSIDHDDLMIMARMFIACHLCLNGMELGFFDRFIRWISTNQNCMRIIHGAVSDNSVVGTSLQISVLHSAIRGGCSGLAKRLLDHNIDQSTYIGIDTTSGGQIPILWSPGKTALSSGNVTVLQELVDFDIDVTLKQLFDTVLRGKTAGSCSPLSISLKDEIIQSLVLVLLEKSANALDVDIVSCAIHSDADTNFVRNILSNEPFANDMTLIGNAASLALHAACMVGSFEHTKYLLKCGANANGEILDFNWLSPKWPPPQYFSESCHMCSESGSSPLVVTAKGESTALATLLLQHGADPNKISSSGCEGTALLTAVRFSTVQMVQVLLDAGAQLKMIQLQQLCEEAISRRKVDVLAVLLEQAFKLSEPVPIAILNALFVQAAQEGCLQAAAQIWSWLSTEKYGPEIERNATTFTALRDAARHGQVHVMRYLVKARSELNITIPTNAGSLLLEAAIRSKSYITVHYVLTNCASDEKDHDIIAFTAAFDLAIKLGCMEIAQLLLDQGVLSCATDPDHYKATLLKMAIVNSQLDKVAALLEEGVSPDGQPRDDQVHNGTKTLEQFPVYIAIGAHDLAILSLLLTYDVDLDVNAGVHLEWDRNDLSPVEYAIACNFVDAVTLLLERSGHVSIREDIMDLFWNELVLSKCSISVSALSHILKSSPLTSRLGQFPVLAWSLYQDEDEFFEMFLHAGADVNRPLNIGGTPLQAALFTKKFGHATRLIDQGADVNASPSQIVDGERPLSFTALQLASLRGHTGCVELLISNGANVNEAAGEVCGRTALQMACEKGFIQVAHLLIRAGARIDGPPSEAGGDTAMGLAVARGRLDVVALLLESSSGDDAVDRLYREAEHKAKKCRRTSILEYLRECQTY